MRATLQERIWQLRQQNFQGRYFVPEAALTELVSKAAVETSLRNLEVPVHEIKDLTDGILRGARKCFAVLVYIGCEKTISGFFRYDSLQRSYPDHRLPYTSEALQQVFNGVEASQFIISQFLESSGNFVSLSCINI